MKGSANTQTTKRNKSKTKLNKTTEHGKRSCKVCVGHTGGSRRERGEETGESQGGRKTCDARTDKKSKAPDDTANGHFLTADSVNEYFVRKGKGKKNLGEKFFLQLCM